MSHRFFYMSKVPKKNEKQRKQFCIPAEYKLYSGCIQKVFRLYTNCIRPEYNLYTAGTQSVYSFDTVTHDPEQVNDESESWAFWP